jgi:hypothetical protein
MAGLRYRMAFSLVLLLMSAALSKASAQSIAEKVASYLTEARSERVRIELLQIAATSPENAQARLGMGLIEFAGAVERLGQSFHRYGLTAPASSFLPVLRLPVPPNPNPEKLDYQKLRDVYDRLISDLNRVNVMLADLPPGEAKIPLDLNAVRLDLNGNGKLEADETLGYILTALTQPTRRGGIPPPPEAPSAPWMVSFDRADAAWLAGYSNLISALVSFTMGYDWSETFKATGHLFFAGAIDRSSPLTSGAGPGSIFGDEGPRFADMLAFEHMVRWPVADPIRLLAVRQHLKEVVRLSRLSWQEILAETDDDHEWIPGPNQRNAAITMLPVTREIIDGWMKVLDDIEGVLNGDKLIPHFRFKSGIDLKMVLEEPQPFDLVLWVTGHAAVPYLKDGDVISWESWNRWNGMLRGNFLGYAVWFN